MGKEDTTQDFSKIQYKPAEVNSFFILFNFLAFFLPSERDSAQESVRSSSESEIIPGTLSSEPASGLGLKFLFLTVLVAIKLKCKMWNKTEGVKRSRKTSLYKHFNALNSINISPPINNSHSCCL